MTCNAPGLWPELANYSEQLLASYWAIHPGFQTLSLATAGSRLRR